MISSSAQNWSSSRRFQLTQVPSLSERADEATQYREDPCADKPGVDGPQLTLKYCLPAGAIQPIEPRRSPVRSSKPGF